MSSFDEFRIAAKAEANDDKSHPLNIVAKLTDTELRLMSFESLEIYTSSTSRIRRTMLSTACADFARVFDAKKYATFEKPCSAILSCVWGRYRDNNRKRIDLLHANQHKKEALELKSQILKLGSGNFQNGLAIYQSQRDDEMASSPYVTGLAPFKISDTLWDAYKTFLNSDAFELWRHPAEDPNYTKPFTPMAVIYPRVTEVVLKMTGDDLEALLTKLKHLKQRGARTLNVSVQVALEWADNQSQPLEYAYMTNACEAGVDEAIPLVDQRYIPSHHPHTYSVLDVLDGLLVTTEQCMVHRWYPHKFHQFTYHNPSFNERYMTNRCIQYGDYVLQVTIHIGNTRYYVIRRTDHDVDLSTLNEVVEILEDGTDLIKDHRLDVEQYVKAMKKRVDL